MAKAGYGTWRTHAAGPSSDFQVLPKKDHVSLIQQATLSVNPCTAYCMLKNFVQLEKGIIKIEIQLEKIITLFIYMYKV